MVSSTVVHLAIACKYVVDSLMHVQSFCPPVNFAKQLILIFNLHGPKASY